MIPSPIVNKTTRSCQVHIFSLNLDDDASRAAVELDALLSKDELSRADKFIFPIHRQRYVRGRTWLRQMLSGFCNVAADQIDLDELEFGKPVLKNAALQFNLSHAENNAVLAVSDSCGVGIDIESYARELDVDGLRGSLYTDLENNWLDGLPAAQQRAGFFKLWTAKEARMKVTGEGFSLPPKEIEVQCDGDEAIRYLNPSKPRVWLTVLSSMGPELCCTLATFEPVNEVIRHP